MTTRIPLLLSVAVAMAALVLAAPARSAPRAVADIPVVHSLLSAVMQGAGVPELLREDVADPHGGSLTPGAARRLGAADLVVWVGPGLTPWLERPLETLAADARHLTLSDLPGLVQRPMRAGAVFVADATKGTTDADGAEGRIMDPHLWLDPQNAIVWVRAMAETLAELDPDRSALYRANGDALARRIDETAEALAARLDGVSPRFVVLHDGLLHFEARFDTPAIAAYASGEGARPGIRRVREVRAAVRDRDARCLLVEPGEGGVPDLGPLVVIEVDTLGWTLPPGPDLYPRLLEGIADALLGCRAS